MLAVEREIHLGEDQDTVDAASLTPSQSRENKRSVCKERQRSVSLSATHAAQGGSDGGGRISLSALDLRGIGHSSTECC